MPKPTQLSGFGPRFFCPKRCKAVLAEAKPPQISAFGLYFPKGNVRSRLPFPFSPNRRKESFWRWPKPTQTTGFGRLISRREMSAAGNRREKAGDSDRLGRNRHGESKRLRETHREGRGRRTRLSFPSSPQARPEQPVGPRTINQKADFARRLRPVRAESARSETGVRPGLTPGRAKSANPFIVPPFPRSPERSLQSRAASRTRGARRPLSGEAVYGPDSPESKQVRRARSRRTGRKAKVTAAKRRTL